MVRADPFLRSPSFPSPLSSPTTLCLFLPSPHLLGNETEPLPGIDTTYDVVQYAAKTYPNKRAFGTRPVLDIVKETKTITKMVGGQETTQDKEWSYFKLGAYEWISKFSLSLIRSSLSHPSVFT